MFTGKIIFFSALDWGIGHVTRSIPLIRNLEQSNTVILGVSSSQKNIYNRYFPHLEQVSLPSYNVRYSRIFPAWFKVFLQLPSLFSTIDKERRLMHRFLKSRKVDVLLSDNRYGICSKKITSILICHQLNVVAPFFNFLVNSLHSRLISKFSEVWVPDYESNEQCLAGKLSRAEKILIPVKYIGPQSALTASASNSVRSCDYLLLLSGPEPSRSEFEKVLLDTFGNNGKKVVLVRGTSHSSEVEYKDIECYDFLSGEELSGFISGAITIVCRSGYSTLMDLHLLNKKNLILVPTPGQPEQEYLAGYWKKKFGAEVIEQKKLAEGLKSKRKN